MKLQPNKSYEMAVYGWQFTHAEIDGTEVKAMKDDVCIDSRYCLTSAFLPKSFKEAINYIYGIAR